MLEDDNVYAVLESPHTEDDIVSARILVKPGHNLPGEGEDKDLTQDELVKQDPQLPSFASQVLKAWEEYVDKSHNANESDRKACLSAFEGRLDTILENAPSITKAAMRQWVEDITWSQFTPDRYVAANYESVLFPDRFISSRLAEDWKAIGADLGTDLSVLEVGGGPNLYPMMAAMPYASQVQVVEYAVQNRRYLESQKQEMGETWEQWSELFEELGPEVYEAEALPAQLAEKLKLSNDTRANDIFELEEESGDVASMHFCAESITEDRGAFLKACESLIEAVRPGGYIVASFMAGSEGYATPGVHCPAVSITADDVREAFSGCQILRLETVPQTANDAEAGNVIREGYHGMLYLCARRRV